MSSVKPFRILAQRSWVAVLVCIAGLLVQRLPLGWPRYAGFGFVSGMIFFGNLFWWAWIDRLLETQGERSLLHRRGWRTARFGWSIYTLIMLLPVFLMMVNRRWWDQWPSSAIMWIMAWNILLACVVAGAAMVMLGRTLLRRLTKAGAPQLESSRGTHAEPVTSLSRRRLLIGAATLPFAGTAAAMIGGKAQEGRFLVRRISMKLPRLPDRLRGLTIAHISDLHTGRLFRPEHLPALVDAVNALKSDLVMVTGDIIDHSNDFLPAACDAIAQFEHRHGRYLVVGNHDLIDNSRAFVEYVGKHEPHFLIDTCVPVEIGGEHIQIAGLGWSGSYAPKRSDPGHTRRAAVALANSDPDRFTVSLVHHPHAFDALVPHGVDLTLAGHTHGGQLMLTPPGSLLRLGAGSLMFHYVWGQYYRGRSALYVNSGVGNWFPVRVNAPAEIVQIQLV